MYVCDNRHKLLAHDESVLKRFPSQCMIPFVLLSRTGLSTSLVNLCTSLVVHGMNLYKIETLILERRGETYAKRLEVLNCHRRTKGIGEIKNDFWASPLAIGPTNDIISKCFLAKSLLDEHIYLREISSGAVISFDHTFKVASNIGYL